MDAAASIASARGRELVVGARPDAGWRSRVLRSDELDVTFAAMVVAGVGLLVTFFNGARIAAMLGQV